MKRLLLFLLFLAASGCGEKTNDTPVSTTANKPAGIISEVQRPIGRVLRYGIFSPVRGGKVIESEQTTTGKALSNLVMTFIRETEQIPIKKDRLLAYQYRLSNIPVKGYAELRRVLKHPAFTRPDGTVTTGSDYTIRKKVERNEVFAYDVYGLNEPYEMVEGEWVFQIWYQDRKLVEQKFTTYWPDEEV